MTTPANLLISKITDRMPAILRPEDWDVWLGERQGGPEDVKMVLRTFHDGGNWTLTEQAPTGKAKSKNGEGQAGCFSSKRSPIKFHYKVPVRRVIGVRRRLQRGTRG